MKRLVTTRIGRDDSLYKRYVDHQSELLTIGGSGSYHGELTPECTHLIAVGPTGQKYKFACQWKISIVSLEWFKKTVTTGFLQDEKEFGIKGRALESPGEASGSQELRTPQNAKRSDSMQPSMVPQTRASELAPDSSFHSDIGSRPVTRNRTAAGSIATDSYDLRLGLTGPLSIDDDDDDDLNVIPIDPLPSMTLMSSVTRMSQCCMHLSVHQVHLTSL
ncbi:protein kinase activating protein dpb11 [Linderina macrospora]|uniref:Protein kinase activating protein dpb11 n=1 Tax=Linderina macrospora TaxID=4868 RepID=A0ACC1J588_9FUNG|nr:protein kinase activating protein dpb11 [Linderina macrospora]